MITKGVARWSKLALLAAGALVLAAMTIGPSYAANNTEVYIVQGLPGKNLDVTIDGDSVATGVKTAAVAGPFKVKPGKRARFHAFFIGNPRGARLELSAPPAVLDQA